MCLSKQQLIRLNEKCRESKCQSLIVIILNVQIAKCWYDISVCRGTSVLAKIIARLGPGTLTSELVGPGNCIPFYLNPEWTDFDASRHEWSVGQWPEMVSFLGSGSTWVTAQKGPRSRLHDAEARCGFCRPGRGIILDFLGRLVFIVFCFKHRSVLFY